MSRTRENINPPLLSFAREQLGYRSDEAADRLKVKEELWVAWENGDRKPTTTQLINISKLLDRTPAFFYLDKVPAEKRPLSEFRTLNNIPLNSASPQLLKAIREATRNRDSLREMYRNQNRVPKKIPEVDQKDSIKEQAKRIREWLNIPIEEQFSWSSSSSGLTQWKNLLENRDIYIVQFPKVDVSEARGFALSSSPFPIVGINSKDSANARIFMLLHELAHVVYGNSIIINDTLTQYFKNGSSIERKCNRLAANVLVPEDALIDSYSSDTTLSLEVSRLSRRFKVSSYVMLIRLWNEGLISRQQFEAMKSEVSFYSGPERLSDGGSPYYNQIVRKGKLLIRTAFQSYFDNKISIAELANLTGWKVPNLNKLAAKTFSWPEEGQYI